MYRPGISELKEFYGTTLGMVVCRKLRARIREYWPELHHGSSRGPGAPVVCGIGFAAPYLVPFLPSGTDQAVLPAALMPAAQGVLPWPERGPNLALLCDETALPLANSAAHYLVLIHALEYAENPLALLNECWRALAPQGKLLVIAPNRLSVWARAESTPFGHGRPFTPRQLAALLREAAFAETRADKALFMPPSQSRTVLRAADMLGRLGRILLHPLGGVLVVEAEKRVYATTPEFSRPRRMVLVPATQSLPRASRRGA